MDPAALTHDLHIFTHSSDALQAGTYLPSRRQRGCRSLRCLAAGGGGGQPWRFDDLTAATSDMTSFDELWGQQLRAMQRAQDRMELQRREVSGTRCDVL